jgi:hypothetical protein
MFCFKEGMTMVSYVPKKGKVVLLISTMHQDDKIDETTQQQRKPEIITTYNFTKGGVDTVDQLCATYTVSRNSRWPLTVFYALLNVAGINAQVIFTTNKTESQETKRNFLKSLARDLVQEHRCVRATSSHVPKQLVPRPQQQAGELVAKCSKRKAHCEVCPCSKDRKTSRMCNKCGKFLCVQHEVYFCQECVSVTQIEMSKEHN